MKKLSIKTLEAFVKVNGKNHKPITEIDEKIGVIIFHHIAFYACIFNKR